MEKTKYVDEGPRERCRSCRYLLSEMKPGNIVHICRRYPPVPTGGVVPVQQGVTVVSQSIFPEMGDVDVGWCGEWSQKLDA